MFTPAEGCYTLSYPHLWASLVTQMVENPPAMQKTWVQLLGWEDPLEKGIWQPIPVVRPGEFHEIPWRRERQPILVVWPGELHGQRSPAGYNPWSRKESDTTKWLSLSISTPTSKLYPSYLSGREILSWHYILLCPMFSEFLVLRRS